MKPPIIGDRTGPRKLAAVKSARGTERWLGGHMSVREPPEFVTAYVSLAIVHIFHRRLDMWSLCETCAGELTGWRAKESTEEAEGQEGCNVG
jgi:hypothetical protein